MAIIKWDPFNTEKWFDDDFHLNFSKLGWDLAIDVYEENNNIVAKMQVPGVDVNKLNISIEDDLLRIAGSREEKEEKKEKDYYQKEIRQGAFERVVRLPCAVEANKTEAKYENGVLKIEMPKKKIENNGKVKIKVK